MFFSCSTSICSLFHGPRINASLILSKPSGGLQLAHIGYVLLSSVFPYQDHDVIYVTSQLSLSAWKYNRPTEKPTWFSIKTPQKILVGAGKKKRKKKQVRLGVGVEGVDPFFPWWPSCPFGEGKKNWGFFVFFFCFVPNNICPCPSTSIFNY